MTITSHSLLDDDSRMLIANAVLQSALDCIVASDAKGRIVEFNPAAERTFGWSRAEAIGQNMDELIIPHHHREAHRKGMARYLATGVAHVLGRRVEIEALHRDGHVFPVELSIVEIGQDSERLFIATLRDLTARREAERERDEARAQLLGLFDHIPTSIYLKRVDHTVVYVSKHLAEQYGKTPDDMVGQYEYDLHIDEMKPILKMMDEHILSTGQAFLAEGTHLQFNRQELVSRFPIFNEKGEITHIGGMNFDINEKALAQAELTESKALVDAFIQNAPNLMVLMKPTGHYVMINEAAARYYGKSPEELLKAGPKVINAPFIEAQTKIIPMMARVIANRKAEAIETLYVMPSGEVRDIAFSLFPILGADGEIAYVGNISHDITEERRAQAELAKTTALFEAFIQNAPYPMALMDATGQHIMVNATASDYYGQTADALLQKDAHYIVSRWPEFKTVIAPMMARVLTQQVNQQADTFFELPSGEMRNMATSLFPIMGADSKLAFIGMISHDTTEERRAQQEVLRSQETLRAFFDHIPAMTFIISRDRKYVSVNNYASNLGLEFLSPQQLIGKPDTTNTPEHWHAVIEDAHRTVVEEGRMVTHTPSIDLPNGSFDLSVSRFPIRDAQGEVVYVGGMIFDQTAEKEAAKQIATSQEALHQSEKLAALGQLLAGVAHELNNPLAIVLGRAAILKDKLAGTPHVDSIQKLRDAADRCARIVKTFLAMARQTGPRRNIVQINELIEGALDMTAYGLRTADIQLEQNLDPALPAIEADEDQIVQLLINLIINAQHALEAQTAERRLAIGTRLDVAQRMAVIEVVDNGPGVPAEVAARIFEPFFTTKGVGEGTGLGLSVCKGMVEAHGGTLTLHETMGGGATFRATFPLLDGVTRDQEANDQEARPSSGHVLIVDDEPEIAAILADCLAPMGVTCAIASDGVTALSLISNTHFDAVFCDVRMPGMDGIAFFARIKAEHPELATRLAFVSGDVLHRDLVRLRAASDRPIIEKPFDPQLVRDIAMLLLAPHGEAQ